MAFITEFPHSDSSNLPMASRRLIIYLPIYDKRVTILPSLAVATVPSVQAVPGVPAVPSVPAVPAVTAVPSVLSVITVPSVPVPSLPSVPGKEQYINQSVKRTDI